MGCPPRCTVHAPHKAMPQPNLVPFIPSTSRSTHSSGISAGTSTSCFRPLIESATMTPSHHDVRLEPSRPRYWFPRNPWAGCGIVGAGGLVAGRAVPQFATALLLTSIAPAFADTFELPISIAAGPLPGGLQTLERQTGIELLYDRELIDGHQSPGVNGTLTTE